VPLCTTRHSTELEFHREAVLQAGFLRFCHVRQSAHPRNGRKAALVSSALKTLCHIRKMHKDRHFPMCPSALVSTQVKRLSLEYKSAFGVKDFIPKRKEPFTRDILVDILLKTPNGHDLGSDWSLSWTSRAGRSLRGLICTLAQTGFRKREITTTTPGVYDPDCLAWNALSFLLRGKIYAAHDAPGAYLRHPQRGDFAILQPGPSKSDPFDMVWGGNPIWLPFQSHEPLCAFSALADMVIFQPVSELESARAPLFSNDTGEPFTGPFLDRVLKHMLRRVLPDASVKLYSWHSARIFLATTLLAANASHAQIQALCRWQTEASISIYGRLSAQVYGELLDRAMSAKVDSARADHLAQAAPFIDLRDVLHAMQQSAQRLAPTDADLDRTVPPEDDADLDGPFATQDEALSPSSPDPFVGTAAAPQGTPPHATTQATPPALSPVRHTGTHHTATEPLSSRPAPQQNINVYWTEDKCWYTGRCTSLRRDPSDASRWLFRVLYDAQQGWRAHVLWHHLDDTTWIAVAGNSRPAPVRLLRLSSQQKTVPADRTASTSRRRSSLIALPEWNSITQELG
jgi:hypothetical protein